VVDAVLACGEVTPAMAAGRLAEMERAAINAAVANARGNLSMAARNLGISRSTLYVKLAAMRNLPSAESLSPQ
jgi:transcriptional regulator of acetoin/glycerol metabolism